MNDAHADSQQNIKSRPGFADGTKEIDVEDAFNVKDQYNDRHIKGTNIILQPSHPKANADDHTNDNGQNL
jgi:hypothetical protein